MNRLLNRFRKREDEQQTAVRVSVGSELNFAASEAYRLLRTNLMFSLPDERSCRVIGVTSANAGEGKSTTAVNLAYMLAEANHHVILIEADMRLPTASRRLELRLSPGLSNLLAGLDSVEEVLQPSGIEDRLTIIASGDIPPNPSELLASRHMTELLETLSERADFIILDLPPVNEVSDALVVSRIVDGIVMVVRQHYASRRTLADAMRQLTQVDAKLLGFVMTCSDTMRKGGYKKGYKKYRYRYGSDYAAAKPEE